MKMKNRYTIELSGIKIPEFAESIEEAFGILVELKETYGGAIYIIDHTLMYKGKIGSVGFPLELFSEDDPS